MKKKAKPRKYQRLNSSKTHAWAHLSYILKSHDFTAATDVEKNAMLIPIYQIYGKWMRGELTNNDYMALNEFNAFGFCLSGLLYERSNAATRELIAPMADKFNRVGDMLKDVGDRYADKGTYSGKAQELDLYKSMLEQLDNLIDVAEIGMCVQALNDAKQLCEGALRGPEFRRLREKLVATKMLDRMLRGPVVEA